MTFQPQRGKILDGQYKLLNQIDSGGFATVWKAEDINTDGYVAAKCGDESSHDRQEVRNRFEKELQVFETFNEGIIPGSIIHFLHGRSTYSDVYIVTELTNGSSLISKVEEPTRQFGQDILFDICLPITQALDFFHRNNYLYLDLKPSNILCRQNGYPTLIDFNTSTPRTENDDTLFHFDGFKPPEQTPTDLRDYETGAWSDVYSLGKLFYYLLSGDKYEIEESSVSDWKPLDPRSRTDNCPRSIANLIMKATSPHPKDRFEDASDFFEVLYPIIGNSTKYGELSLTRLSQSIHLWPGSTIGRWDTDQEIATVLLNDENNYISPIHLCIDYQQGQWHIQDLSINGTWIKKNSNWKYLLSSNGLKQQRSNGRSLPESNPAERTLLTDGDIIAPVDPDYGFKMTFREK